MQQGLVFHFCCSAASCQAKELTEQGWLSNSEIQSLQYLRVLESYYPLQSYDRAMATHSRQHPRSVNTTRIVHYHVCQVANYVYL